MSVVDDSPSKRLSSAGDPRPGRSALLDRLKRETRPAHERIERDLGLLAPTFSRECYSGLIARFYGFFRAWEPRIASALADEAFFEPRRKSHLLERDLRSLGLDDVRIAALRLCPDLPRLASRAEAMGSLYVLEGSTLGGQLVARHLAATLHLGPAASAYFRSYGHDVGPMWRAFRARLAALSGPETDEVVIRSADATFARLDAWLCHGK